MPGRLCMFDDLAFKEDVFNKLGDFRDTIGIIHKQYNIAPTLNISIFTNTHLYTYAHFGLIPSSWFNIFPTHKIANCFLFMREF
ncbi:MAG TPA: hypothetical protein EYO73_02080 [Sulfurimonas sp.]|nr:hypothetical protein [Sulfurimonas sp.]